MTEKDERSTAVRCTAGRSVGPDPDAHRCGNYTRRVIPSRKGDR